MSTYVRTSGGRWVHRRGCPRIRSKAVPWNWAEGKPPEQIREELVALGLSSVKFCTRCMGDAQ